MIFEIFGLVIALLLIFYAFNFIKELIGYFRLIKKLPGPKESPLLGNLQDFLCDQTVLFQKLRKWARDYYPVYRMSAGFYYAANISSAEDFERVASTTRNLKKSETYKFLHLWLGEGLLTSTGSTWQTRRKILTPAFHFSILQQFISVFIAESDQLVKVLKEQSHKPYINVVPIISQFTLRAINETAMGTQLNSKNDEDRSYCNATFQIGKIIAYRIFRPWLYYNALFYRVTRLGREEKTLVKILHDFTNKVIQERSRKFEKFEINTNKNTDEFNYSKRKKLAMLDLLLNAKISDGSIDDKGIQDEVNTFMFEGHDTTSMGLCFMLMLLASHKDVQESILQEIRNVLPDPQIQPTYNDLQELKYTERCIKESLRIYPSVPFIARISDEEIKTTNGYIIPKKATIHIHILDIHRDPNVYPNPEKFDPDRFLPENCQNRHPFAFVPFSAGPRNCIGQKFAVLELKVALCKILRNFELEPVHTQENIKLIPDVILRAENEDIRVKFIPREIQ